MEEEKLLITIDNLTIHDEITYILLPACTNSELGYALKRNGYTDFKVVWTRNKEDIMSNIPEEIRKTLPYAMELYAWPKDIEGKCTDYPIMISHYDPKEIYELLEVLHGKNGEHPAFAEFFSEEYKQKVIDRLTEEYELQCESDGEELFKTLIQPKIDSGEISTREEFNKYLSTLTEDQQMLCRSYENRIL